MQRIWTRRELMGLALGAGAAGALILSGCGGSDDNSSDNGVGPTVYVGTNDRRAGQNAVLQYSRTADGRLTLVNSFPTGGTGYTNDSNFIGTQDGDYDILATPDRRFLFALNSGSDSIAVFRIERSGGLTPVAGSPFASGGLNPVGLAYVNGNLYVVNANNDPARSGGTPSYTSFSVDGDGQLTPLAGGTIPVNDATLPVPSPPFFVNSATPTNLVPSPDGRLLFSTILFAGMITSFQVGANGLLSVAPGSPQLLPVYPSPANALIPDLRVAVNLSVHPDPTRRVIYAHFTALTQLGVYTYDATGQLTFVRAVSNGGLGVCWSRFSRDGRALFTLNTFDNTISVYDLTDPLNPVEVQVLALPMAAGETPANMNPFRLSLEPGGQFLYVQSQRAQTDPTVLTGNAVHVLRVGADNRLTTFNEARVEIPVPADSRAQGLLAL